MTEAFEGCFDTVLPGRNIRTSITDNEPVVRSGPAQ